MLLESHKERELTWFHVDLGVLHEIELCQLGIVIKSISRVLEVIMGKEAGVNVFVQELSQFKHHLVLDHLSTHGVKNKDSPKWARKALALP